MDEFEDFHPSWKYHGAEDGEVSEPYTIHSGNELDNGVFPNAYSHDAMKVTYSRHFTILFNVFVFLQFFNFLNARKIEDEWNIFG